MDERLSALGELADALTLVPDEAARETLLAELAAPGRPRVLAFINAHAANLAGDDPGFRADLRAADLRLRDGSGMALLLRKLGRDPGLNLNGTDFIPALLAAYRGRRVALLGTSEPWLTRAAAVVENETPVVLALDGFKADEEYLAALRGAPADLVILAMGMPKQERVAALLRASLPAPALVVCGGAILDFLAGRVPRAPRWMRAAGIEWLYRLLREPRRLFRRYVIGNAVFLTRARALVRARRGGGAPAGGAGADGR